MLDAVGDVLVAPMGDTANGSAPYDDWVCVTMAGGGPVRYSRWLFSEDGAHPPCTYGLLVVVAFH